MAEREFALPDVAMELPSYVPDDDWASAAGPSRLHPFGAEVKNRNQAIVLLHHISANKHSALKIVFRDRKSSGVFRITRRE